MSILALPSTSPNYERRIVQAAMSFSKVIARMFNYDPVIRYGNHLEKVKSSLNLALEILQYYNITPSPPLCF